MNKNIIKFGTKAFVITSAKWDSERQVGLIEFEDDNGVRYNAESLGMLKVEQRDAVFDAVKNAWIDAQAKEIEQTAERLVNTEGPDFLKELAIAFGNTPYEDGEGT